LDEPERRRQFCERIERAVNKLPRMEKFLLQERCMYNDANYITDYNVCTQKFQPSISEGTYSKRRWQAFYKLTLALDIAKHMNS
jgi:hypothetical protein